MELIVVELSQELYIQDLKLIMEVRFQEVFIVDKITQQWLHCIVIMVATHQQRLETTARRYVIKMKF